jgi:hypothetical protein
MIPVFLFLFGINEVDASPMNLLLITLNGPFFQGWLVRTVDHDSACSFITIIGSFSKAGMKEFTEHYIFCGIQQKDKCWHYECFPSVASVTISGSNPSSSSIFQELKPSNITWSADGIGSFHLTEDVCKIDFSINNCRIQSQSFFRKPWKLSKAMTDGPEGWLGYTPLLPCHYYIHSTGSPCTYRLQLPDGNLIDASTKAYTHIEGNHGTFSPEGWTWAQGLSTGNKASFSLVGGLFEIGPLKRVLYLRVNDKSYTFRTTDADKIEHYINFSEGLVSIQSTSLNQLTKLELDISSCKANSDAFGKAIHIPTVNGFSNRPGCKETYTASAVARLYSLDVKTMSYLLQETVKFELVALEFGAEFQRGLYKSSSFPLTNRSLLKGSLTNSYGKG